jgi:imidazolonepropionase-like amidohydrolase
VNGHPIAIVGATVIDGRGGKPIDDGVIVIQRDRIVTVGGPETPVPPAAQRLPMAGKYVIPGLLDANVHLVLDYFPATLVRFWDRYDELAIEAAAIALRNGVTTVFDTWGPRTHLIRARTAIREGRSVGSRIFLAGNIVGLDGPLSEDFFRLYPDLPITSAWVSSQGSLRTGKCEEARPEDAHEG